MEKRTSFLLLFLGVFLCLLQGIAPLRCMLPERTNGEIFFIIGYTGRIFDEGLPIGEHVTIAVRCNPGFTPQSYVRTGCSDIGQWLVPVPICVRRERLCAKPGYISHVVQYVNGVDTNELSSYPHNELPEGTFLVSRCSLPGTYELRGSANRTCVEGRWSGEEPRCDNAGTEIYFQNNQPMEIRSNGTIVIYPQSLLRIFCRMPYGSNAIAHLTSDNGPVGVYWSDHYGLSVMISMNPPRAWHSGRYTCQSRDGAMSHSVFIQVAAIDCEQPRAPQNGAVLDNDFGWKYQRYPIGKQVIFTCNRGYNRDGASRSKCVFGEWSRPVPRCIRATCPELQPPSHGTKIGGNTVGHSVIIGCNQGYQLQGESFLDCLESGNWSHPLPTCIEETRSPNPSCNPDLTFIEEPEDLERTEGVLVELRCRVSDEDAIILWFKDGQRLNPALNHLGFFRIVPEDATIDTDVVNFHVFNCTPQDDRWSISWEKDGEPIENPNPMSGNLLLQNMTEEDEGKYTCVVRSRWSRSEGRADAWLFLSEPPQLDISTKVTPA